ncbi:DUF6197 family protein [Phytohabitans kaempferiae]|uniref:Uncharacterized protein n=1 Tax=Phytohabitans kaempferiae TaxID=1620943 RepID=A0ABV6M0J6_9ACTN
MNPTQNPPTAPALPEDVTPADVLRCAAIYIRLHGWHQGDLYPNEDVRRRELLTTPPACAYGAIGMAVFGRPLPIATHQTSPDYNRLFTRACAALDDYLTDAHPNVTHNEYGEEIFYGTFGDAWNDQDGRTVDNVTYALDAAAGYYDTTHTPAGGAR